ncbi:MAG: hypothetical protein K8W52_05440 [Deltaproteobacteria bacterium]|nr:hypothetical protein [Deltaproteobacteria bacterium]
MDRTELVSGELWPWSSGAPSAMACLGLHLATRARPEPPGRAFAGRDQILEAHARGALALSETVRVGGWTTTAGRFLVAACLPPEARVAADAPWDASRAVRVLDLIMRMFHVEVAARAAQALDELGTYVALRSGFSLALDDFAAPREAEAAIAHVRRETTEANAYYATGDYTDGERFNRIVDAWWEAAAVARLAARRCAPDLDPLAAAAASSPAMPRPDALRSMRGVRQTPTGDIAAQDGTLARGFGTHEFFLACAEARTEIVEAAARAGEAERLRRDLLAVIGDVAIVAVDCGATRGVTVRAIDFFDEPAGAFARVVEGRVAAAAIAMDDGEALAAGTLITPRLARRIEAAVRSIEIRDVQTCEAEAGVCARCFGLAPEDAIWPTVGDRVGVRAAETIAAAAERLPRKFLTFIC